MIISREEFNSLIDKLHENFVIEWENNSQVDVLNPIIKVVSLERKGRCRHCTKQTNNVFIRTGELDRHPIMRVVGNLLNKNYVCSLDCLYSFICEREAEILEEITK